MGDFPNVRLPTIHQRIHYYHSPAGGLVAVADGRGWLQLVAVARGWLATVLRTKKRPLSRGMAQRALTWDVGRIQLVIWWGVFPAGPQGVNSV